MDTLRPSPQSLGEITYNGVSHKAAAMKSVMFAALSLRADTRWMHAISVGSMPVARR